MNPLDIKQGDTIPSLDQFPKQKPWDVVQVTHAEVCGGVGEIVVCVELQRWTVTAGPYGGAGTVTKRTWFNEDEEVEPIY